jgi:hypothetical protein
MTQEEFAKWLDGVIGGDNMEELVAAEILEHVSRIHLEGEHRAWQFCKEESREAFETVVRAISKSMFLVGYQAGREQGAVDNLFGSGSGMSAEDKGDSSGMQPA